jgi:hypothetical protein
MNVPQNRQLANVLGIFSACTTLKSIRAQGLAGYLLLAHSCLWTLATE